MRPNDIYNRCRTMQVKNSSFIRQHCHVQTGICTHQLLLSRQLQDTSLYIATAC